MKSKFLIDADFIALLRDDELLAYYNLSLRVKKQNLLKPQVVASLVKCTIVLVYRFPGELK